VLDWKKRQTTRAAVRLSANGCSPIAKRTRKIHDIPFIEFLKEPPARKGFLTVEKFEELIALLPTHLRHSSRCSTTAELESVRRCKSNGVRSTLTSDDSFGGGADQDGGGSRSCHCRRHL